MEIAKERPLDFSVNRGGKRKEKSVKSYSGAYYNVGFKVDKDIFLTGFSFFPPILKKMDKNGADVLCSDFFTAKFHIQIVKQHAPKMYMCGAIAFPGESEIIEEFKLVKRKDEMMKVDEYVRVNPPRLLPIEADTWHDIKFEIDGPRSGHLDENRTRMQIVSAGKDMVKTDFPFARFDFHQGSGQLPEIHFMLQ